MRFNCNLLRPISAFEKCENVYITDHNLIPLKDKEVGFIKSKSCFCLELF